MNAKTAIAVAKSSFLELFIDEAIQNVGLEELELDEDSKVWNVTLGFHRTQPSSTPFGMTFPTERVYKVVSISNETGNVVSIRNREIAQA